MQEKRHDISESNNDTTPLIPIPTAATSPVFSGQKIHMDYITLRGIETRTGVKKDDLYMLIPRESLDNALDYMEIHCPNTTPQVSVTITKEEGDSLLRIIVRNPVDANSNITLFSKGMLRSIYDFSGYYSSKRIRKISRGSLGDASKLVLGIPYALAKEMSRDISGWNQLLTIRSNSGSNSGSSSSNNLLRTFYVRLLIDRLNNDIRSEVIEEEDNNDVNNKNNITSKYTEFEICLPLSHDDFLIDKRISTFLQNYALLNTHIGFTFNLFGRASIQYSPTQPIINVGKNISSIYYYNLSEFQDFIYELQDNSQIVYDVLRKTVREAKALSKSELTLMTVGQLKQLSADRIKEIYEQLRKAMPPISIKTGLSSFLPFSTNKTVRRKAIEDRLKQAGIYFENIKYRQIHGYHKEDNGVEFPYFFEIAVIHSNSHCLNDNLKVIQSINSTITPNKNNEIFGRSFEYITGNTRWTNASIFNIFSNYGYTDNIKGCKKPNSIIIVNLISPVVNYKNFSKSQIDASPFAVDIAETIVKACKGGGRGLNSDERPSRKEVLKEILEERMDKWFALDKKSRQKNWWTMSDIFYATRKRLIDYEYTNEEINREYITGLIKETCEQELGVNRQDIGIIAADRAQLHFKGEWKDVGLREIDELIQYGIDMIIIEKEGVAEQLASFADDKGIALLNTRGFLTEYASVLSTKSEKEGCNIAILTDLDASGLVLAAKVAWAYRIGIDFDTLADLGLDIEDVEEEYDPKKHLNPLKLDGEHAGLYSDEIVDYVSKKRVEINSVIATLDDNIKFWEWIVEKLRKKFHKRNYNRAVNIPVYVKPSCLEKLEDIIEEKGTTILEKQREGLQKRLSNIENGFLFDSTNRILPEYNIDKYEAEITKQSRNIIENNCDMKPLLEKIEDIMTEEEE